MKTIFNRVIFYSGIAALVTLVIIGMMIIIMEWLTKKLGLQEAAS